MLIMCVLFHCVPFSDVADVVDVVCEPPNSPLTLLRSVCSLFMYTNLLLFEDRVVANIRQTCASFAYARAALFVQFYDGL